MDNIISFEEYREKKLGRLLDNSPINELFRKDLREQKELLDWYSFHNMINAHKLFIHTLFLQNHVKGMNNNSGYVVCYNEKHMNDNTGKIVEAVQWEERRPVIIDATNKSFIQIGEMVTGCSQKDNYNTHKEIKHVLLTSDNVFIFKGLSAMKASNKEKIMRMRTFIKILDDAHFENIQPKADLIFVDYAKFLQDSWEQVGIYLNVMS